MNIFIKWTIIFKIWRSDNYRKSDCLFRSFGAVFNPNWWIFTEQKKWTFCMNEWMRVIMQKSKHCSRSFSISKWYFKRALFIALYHIITCENLDRIRNWSYYDNYLKKDKIDLHPKFFQKKENKFMIRWSKMIYSSIGKWLLCNLCTSVRNRNKRHSFKCRIILFKNENQHHNCFLYCNSI